MSATVELNPAVELARCYACGEELPVEDFSRDKAKASGRSSICRPCDALKGRAYYAANRERVRARYTPVVREAACAGCGETFVATNGRQRYCEPGCRSPHNTGAKVEAVCDFCGKPFEARARDRDRGGGRYCSKSCALRARHRREALQCL